MGVKKKVYRGLKKGFGAQMQKLLNFWLRDLIESVLRGT